MCGECAVSVRMTQLFEKTYSETYVARHTHTHITSHHITSHHNTHHITSHHITSHTHTNTQTQTQTNKQPNKQTNKQTNKHTHTHRGGVSTPTSINAIEHDADVWPHRRHRRRPSSGMFNVVGGVPRNNMGNKYRSQNRQQSYTKSKINGTWNSLCPT